MTIWYAEDTGDATACGFGRTKRDAEECVIQNRGYSDRKRCIADGWMRPAIRITVLEVVATNLLYYVKKRFFD